MAKTKGTSKIDNKKADDFELPDTNEFETLETTFPPIFNFINQGDTITFLPVGTSEGVNGTLVVCKLVSNTGGIFKKKDEELELSNGDIFSLGANSVIVGINKIVTAEKKGVLTELSEYCKENDSPIRLIFEGIEKSTKNKMFKYKKITIQLKRGVIEALKS